jgi:predicted site-specific integrase-resolvase
MKLSDWARSTGITYKTAHRWFQQGILPIPVEQLPTGTLLVHPPTTPYAQGVALYARVSSADQKTDLERQLARVVAYATAQSMPVVQSVTEIGSGLNGHRPRLMKLLRDPAVTTIVIEHRDRLVRFGAEYIEAALAAMGRRIVVVDEAEMKDDLVQDMLDVLVSFCARLYGRRSAKNRAKRALASIESS